METRNIKQVGSTISTTDVGTVVMGAKGGVGGEASPLPLAADGLSVAVSTSVAGSPDININKVANTATQVGEGVAGAGTLRVATATPSTIVAGNRNVALAGTPVTLTAGSVASKSVVIQAKLTNTDSIYIGSLASQDIELSAGMVIGIDINDLQKIYIDAAVNTEGVNYLANL